MSTSTRSKNLRIDSSKLSFTDINKIKQLPITPYVEEGSENNFYIEPVTIEYYIPKESRFAYESKFLYVELYDPIPQNETQKKLMEFFTKKGEPIDPIEVMNIFPQYIEQILNSYNMHMELLTSASIEFKAAISGLNLKSVRRALYVNEVLRKGEPKLAALDILGDYTTFNINWCIRFCNKNNIEHVVEDPTVEYLLKLHRMKYEDEHRALDERFEILAGIYMDQAFPYQDDIFEDDDDF